MFLGFWNFNIFNVAKLSSSRQKKFQLNWDKIIIMRLPAPNPNRPEPNGPGIFLIFSATGLKFCL